MSAPRETTVNVSSGPPASLPSSATPSSQTTETHQSQSKRAPKYVQRPNTQGAKNKTPKSRPSTEHVSDERDISRPQHRLHKYWLQRYALFHRFDEGIQMDDDSWFSVTPESIAEHIAQRMACRTVVEGFCGVGGNAIQLAFYCRNVIAIDIDPEKIKKARHNAAIYGVDDRIQFICGDYFTVINEMKIEKQRRSSLDSSLLPNDSDRNETGRSDQHTRVCEGLCYYQRNRQHNGRDSNDDSNGAYTYKYPPIDAIFMAPPWGGVDYLSSPHFDLEGAMPYPASSMIRAAFSVTPNVCIYLPRTVDPSQLALLASLSSLFDPTSSSLLSSSSIPSSSACALTTSPPSSTSPCIPPPVTPDTLTSSHSVYHIVTPQAPLPSFSMSPSSFSPINSSSEYPLPPSLQPLKASWLSSIPVPSTWNSTSSSSLPLSSSAITTAVCSTIDTTCLCHPTSLVPTKAPTSITDCIAPSDPQYLLSSTNQHYATSIPTSVPVPPPFLPSSSYFDPRRETWGLRHAQTEPPFAELRKVVECVPLLNVSPNQSSDKSSIITVPPLPALFQSDVIARYTSLVWLWRYVNDVVCEYCDGITYSTNSTVSRNLSANPSSPILSSSPLTSQSSQSEHKAVSWDFDQGVEEERGKRALVDLVDLSLYFQDEEVTTEDTAGEVMLEHNVLSKDNVPVSAEPGELQVESKTPQKRVSAHILLPREASAEEAALLLAIFEPELLNQIRQENLKTTVSDSIIRNPAPSAPTIITTAATTLSTCGSLDTHPLSLIPTVQHPTAPSKPYATRTSAMIHQFLGKYFGGNVVTMPGFLWLIRVSTRIQMIYRSFYTYRLRCMQNEILVKARLIKGVQKPKRGKGRKGGIKDREEENGEQGNDQEENNNLERKTEVRNDPYGETRNEGVCVKDDRHPMVAVGSVRSRDTMELTENQETEKSEEPNSKRLKLDQAGTGQHGMTTSNHTSLTKPYVQPSQPPLSSPSMHPSVVVSEGNQSTIPPTPLYQVPRHRSAAALLPQPVLNLLCPAKGRHIVVDPSKCLNLLENDGPRNTHESISGGSTRVYLCELEAAAFNGVIKGVAVYYGALVRRPMRLSI